MERIGFEDARKELEQNLKFPLIIHYTVPPTRQVKYRILNSLNDLFEGSVNYHQNVKFGVKFMGQGYEVSVERSYTLWLNFILNAPKGLSLDFVFTFLMDYNSFQTLDSCAIDNLMAKVNIRSIECSEYWDLLRHCDNVLFCKDRETLRSLWNRVERMRETSKMGVFL